MKQKWKKNKITVNLSSVWGCMQDLTLWAEDDFEKGHESANLGGPGQ